MKRRTVRVGVVLAVAALAVTARADVTMKAKTSGTGFGALAAGESVTYLKGSKMRPDSVIDGELHSTIFDLDAQTMTSLEHKKKKAEVFRLADLADTMRQVTDDSIRAEIKPTGKSRTVASRSCEEYSIKIVIPNDLGEGMKMDMVLSGSACVAGSSPGAADVKRFYTAAAEKGFFFNDPRAAKAQPGQAKAMTKMYRDLAQAGVPYETEFQFSFEGEGPMAAMMSKMGSKNSTKNTVIDVTTEGLSDGLFEVPPDFKVKSK